jgi:hypothetical protein
MGPRADTVVYTPVVGAQAAMAAKQPRIVPPAVSQKRRKPIPKCVRIVQSLHPKRAAIVLCGHTLGWACDASATQLAERCEVASLP